ncbi:SDR family oxidoreductase [Deinococcus pimensis]|uniref:SDR family oxidoreductase n=1 Tax=Deinococcus pimensis TaxID=309888 RepID=UPI000487A76F|nr:sugar nucleotide-binding protein [Deinococcus pimensis]
MRILLTGGTGRLGTELRALLPDLIAPRSAELDVRDLASVRGAVERERPDLIVHAAAYTDVSGAERDRRACWDVNVTGTRHVARAAREAGARLLHVSTDYVFDGERGGYREDDPPGPPVNYYALTKLVAEEAARAADRHLVLRTSFRPREWPYPVAFSDVYTSQDYVDVIAPDVARIIVGIERVPFETLHVATERKSVFELARRRRPDVRPGSRTEANVRLPSDVSLDVSRWQDLRGRL